MHRRCSRTDGRMRRQSSCTNDYGTKVLAKGVKRMHRRRSRANGRMRRRSSRTNGRKTKVVRRLRRWSTHTNGRSTRDSGMDALMTLTNPESRSDKRTAVARIRRTPRQEGQEANSLEIDAWLMQCQLLWLAQSKSSRSAQNNNKENTKTSTRNNGKRGRTPAMAQEKKNNSRE